MVTVYLSSAPARVCLYGEHQDYLLQKVIPAAINLRLKIISAKVKEEYVIISSKNLNKSVRISPSVEKLSNPNDSFKSFMEAGIISLKHKFKDIQMPSISATIESSIPVASGLSSSAALQVGWISHLAGILELNLKNDVIAELAYDAEHNVMNIPCGKMDQYSSAFGSIISLSCTEPPKLKYLNEPNSGLIIVNSNTPKLTSDVHGSKVNKIKNIVQKIKKLTNLELENIQREDIGKYEKNFSKEELSIIQAVVSIREDTKLAERELQRIKPDLHLLGKLLSSQQNALREGIKVSLPILDRIVKTGIEEGALGGKLTGAGLGGCVVFLVEENGADILQRIKVRLKLPIWLAEFDEGVYFKDSFNDSSI
ncbi:MAG: GHMP family kinase ATP-binding protein [Candidatus Heimdallarchaeaceae archaeon]